MKKNEEIKFIFFGTPEPAVSVLETLKSHGLIPRLIVTSSDKPSGRGLKTNESPVATWATDNGIPVEKPITLKDGVLAKKIKDLNPDLALVFAYGKIIPEEVLSAPAHGTLNIHPSLLPKYRGPSPVEGSILAGDSRTGVSLMVIDKEMDHGPIVAQEEFDILDDETAPELTSRLVTAGAEMFARLIQKYLSNELKLLEQNHDKSTYTKKITKSDGEISLDEPAKTLWQKYSAYYEWPGIYFTTIYNNKNIRVVIKKAKYEPARPDNSGRSGGNGEFKILRVLPEGKKEMDYADFLRGKK